MLIVSIRKVRLKEVVLTLRDSYLNICYMTQSLHLFKKFFYYFLIKLFIYFIFFAVQSLSCSMWDLVPWPGIEPWPPALGAWSLSHWSIGKSLSYFLIEG